MTATARSVELRSIAQEIADALPTEVEEVVVTGSVSRGVADEISDIEMLVVTGGELALEGCYAHAAAAAPCSGPEAGERCRERYTCCAAVGGDGGVVSSGAKARVPADTSSAFAAQESLRIGRYLPQALVESRSDAQLAGAQSQTGSTRYGYVVAGGELIIAARSSVRLSGFDGVAGAGVGPDDRFTIGVGFP